MARREAVRVVADPLTRVLHAARFGSLWAFQRHCRRFDVKQPATP
jgi:hypothetical protein